MTPLRTLAFGDLTVWGTAWVAEPGGGALAALGPLGTAGAGAEVTVLPDIDLSDSDARPSGEWRLEGYGVTLLVSSAGVLVDVHAAEDDIEGWDQLCRVSGRFDRGGQTHEVDCLGLRSSWSDAVDLGKFESIRAVSAWFEPDEGMSVTAFRPRKTKAHDGDALAAAVITADGSPAVEDPRLSTTYAGEGWPARAGLELWVSGNEPDQQFPRRASGEALGARAQARAGEHEIWAEPFRWHSRGREGAGVYLLARRR
jgi:hypothetical protein